MTDAQANVQGNTTWWITSLAISVVCCAILFVVFAGYLFGFREKLLIVETKLSIIEQRNMQLSMEIDNLHRRTPIQQIQVIPPGMSQQYIQSSVPSAEASGKGDETTPIVGVPAHAQKTNASERNGGAGTAGEGSPAPSSTQLPQQLSPSPSPEPALPTAPKAGTSVQAPATTK